MENTENQGVGFRISTREPTVPDYRPLIEVPAGRMLMPARSTIIVDVTGDPGVGRLEFDLELADRRYVIRRLEALPPAGGALDLGSLGSMYLSNFLRAGLAHRIVIEHRDGDTYTSERPMTNPDPLWPVALTYTIAQVLGENPTAAVAAELHISEGAAAQRVKSARDAGYLPKTTKGRAS